MLWKKIVIKETAKSKKNRTTSTIKVEKTQKPSSVNAKKISAVETVKFKRRSKVYSPKHIKVEKKETNGDIAMSKRQIGGKLLSDPWHGLYWEAEGTLAPQLASYSHKVYYILRNNSFTGIIPEGIIELKELEVLDLGYKNRSRSFPPELGSNLSLTILLLDHNELQAR
ncbi:hypothetical protein COLO4_31448 [Corchorus olitorius]|uniref:Uncharacterized protein n=1 Tax=Corchorus olitorius TaxID=93759 RepID=A0A1R3H4F8_9ROSI|nr:hypothetical protein COLO4_31448 [Corchorus olitorius]